MDNENDQLIYGDQINKGFFGSLKDHIIDLIQTLVVFGAIFTVIYLFVAQPHKVSGSSMIPTFQNGDYIITDKLSYKLGQPKKGDIIVLAGFGAGLTAGANVIRWGAATLRQAQDSAQGG